MKKSTVILLILLLCLFCACSSVGEKEKDLAYLAPIEFSSVGELIDFLGTKEVQGGQNVLNYITSSIEDFEIPNETAFASAFDAELVAVTLSGNYANYVFSVNNVNVPFLAEHYNFDSISCESTADDKQIVMDEFATFAQRITVTCNVKSEDGASLINFASENPVEYWEEHPGFYYTRAPLIDMDDPYGYMIYWEDYENFFQAYIPAHLVDSFFENYDSLIETVTIGNYSKLETE